MMFVDGIQVGEPCTGGDGATALDPDPCVLSRATDAEGDGHLVVKTTTFSVWNFAVALATPCHDLNNDGKVSGRDVSIVARALTTQNPTGDLNNDGVVDLGDLFLVLRSLIDPSCR
ncbi:MAG: hypothetical protein J4N71_09655 [Chloroflexi bacterium]|nr:hypothetical protein [Chloroflexota bacterium]